MDVDTGESLFVPLSVVLKNGGDNVNDNDNDKDNNNDAADENEDEGDDKDEARKKWRADDSSGRGSSGNLGDDAALLRSLKTRPPRRSVGGAGGDGMEVARGDGGGGGEEDAEAVVVGKVREWRRGTGEGGGRRGGGVLALVTPCILPDLNEVSRLSIHSPRYFPVELDIEGNPSVMSALRRRCRIYVKRRVGHLSYKNVSAGEHQGKEYEYITSGEVGRGGGGVVEYAPDVSVLAYGWFVVLVTLFSLLALSQQCLVCSSSSSSTWYTDASSCVHIVLYHFPPLNTVAKNRIFFPIFLQTLSP